jgi:hypothetical protein
MGGMSIQAADVAPSFLNHAEIVAADLPRISDPCVVLEHSGRDADGEPYHCFTIGGWLDGKPLGSMLGGCTVGGDVIIISGMDAEDAKLLAGMGLQDTIDGMRRESERYIDAQAARARLASVSPIVRMDKASAPAADKSDAFEHDAKLIRSLRGDDIVLTTS